MRTSAVAAVATTLVLLAGVPAVAGGLTGDDPAPGKAETRGQAQHPQKAGHGHAFGHRHGHGRGRHHGWLTREERRELTPGQRRDRLAGLARDRAAALERWAACLESDQESCPRPRRGR
jgi:hypothetical protein